MPIAQNVQIRTTVRPCFSLKLQLVEDPCRSDERPSLTEHLGRVGLGTVLTNRSLGRLAVFVPVLVVVTDGVVVDLLADSIVPPATDIGVHLAVDTIGGGVSAHQVACPEGKKMGEQ